MSLPSPLQVWARKLLEAPAKPGATDPRIKDALAAFVAGLSTADGRALARLHARRLSASEIISAVAAIARQSECDDIELSSCITPGAVVIPVALGCAQIQADGVIETAILRGYETGIICGRALGGVKALPKVWPTLVAAPLMAAVTVSFLRGYDRATLVNAMALALAGVSGRAGRPSGSPSGRWISFAEAVAKGIHSADAAAAGFRGDPDLCDPGWWQTQAGHNDIDERVFDNPAWPEMDDTDYKPFPMARQAATAVEAFQRVLANGIDPNTIQTIEAVVPRMNVALLSRPANPDDRTSLLCNLGFQFACAAYAPDLLYNPERNGATAALIDFARRVRITPTTEFEQRFPRLDRWPARVIVQTAHGQFSEELDQISLGAPSCDPAKLQNKWERLLRGENRQDFFANAANPGSISHAMLWEWIRDRLAKAAQSGASA